MKNSLQLAINAVLVIAVAVLFYLHFANQPTATTPKKPVAATAPSDSATSSAIATEDPADLTAAADTEKVAYVESSKLLDGYQGMKDARRSFEAKAKRWEAQNQKMVQGFQGAVQKYQQQAASLTAEQRAATEQQLQGRQMQVLKSRKSCNARPKKRKLR
nr:OmpH family outer membrane protein [Hymenobacter sp. AT01-02]